MLIYRLILALLVVSCLYLVSTIDSQAGTTGSASCESGECQGNEDDCFACSDGGTECWWDGDFCRNPGACCFTNPPSTTPECVVISGFNCENEFSGEYFGDDSTCVEITCGEPEPPAGPSFIVPTMGQWGMILASIILGAIGILGIMREKNLNKYINS